MDKTRQADQQFLSELWHRFNAEWLPALTNLLLLLWEWLLANLIITAILSGLLLLGGCLIVRKATGKAGTLDLSSEPWFSFYSGWPAWRSLSTQYDPQKKRGFRLTSTPE